MSNISSVSTGYKMPAEWAFHERCLMSWPSRNYWGSQAAFEEALKEWAAVANAVACFEPVTMVVAPNTPLRVRSLLDDAVELLEFPVDDAWMRDNGPIFVVNDQGQREAVHFRFNAWGGKFPPWDKDEQLAQLLLQHLGVPRRVSELVLEGGSIVVDGEGTLITTEQCLLHRNRNPTWSKAEIEAELMHQLGVSKVVWLPFGHSEDRHTDGHVDGILAYLAPGKVLLQTCSDPAHPDYPLMQANLEVLRSSSDARGRQFEVIEMPLYPYFEAGGVRDMVCYCNFYTAHGRGGKGIVLPVAQHAMDEKALEILAAAMPGYEVVRVPGQMLAIGGGGPHCITQQMPAVTPEVKP